MDERELAGVWDAYHQRRTRTAIEKGVNRVIVERALAEIDETTALDALRANRHLVDLLIGHRWYVMCDAREAGASWAEIGAALGISKQGARDWYRCKIADREARLGDLHDGARAEAALRNGG